MSARATAAILAALLVAQLAAGAHYISRTALVDGATGERVFVLWDDAMISMRYARNLAEGYGLVWNPGGERVQGFTNLGLTLAMAGVHALGVAPERASLWIQILALAAVVATAALAALLAARLARRDGEADDPSAAWPAVAAALALLVCAPHQIYALQGADTIFISLALLAAAWSFARSTSRGVPALAVAALALGMLVRLDAALFAGAAAAVAAHGFAGGAAARARAAAPLAATIAVVALGVLGFGLAYYGDPLPNTYYLKATGSPRALVLESGIAQLASFGWRWIPALALAVVGARAGGRAASFLATSIALAAAYHVWVGGDWISDYGSRYLVQVVPALVVLAAAGARALARRAPAAARGAIAAVLPAACVLLAGPTAPAREWFDPSAATLLHRENQGNFDRARFLARATRGDLVVGAHWAGIGPYFAGRETIDMLGRADRTIARMTVDRFVPGHSKWDWDYVLDVARPDLIDFGSRGLRDHPHFRRDYAALIVGPQAVLFVRRESLDKVLDPTLAVVLIEDLLPKPVEDASDVR